MMVVFEEMIVSLMAGLGGVVVSSNPLSDLVQESWRSRLYLAAGLVAIVTRYGVQVTGDEVIMICPGGQVKTDCPASDISAGRRGLFG